MSASWLLALLVVCWLSAWALTGAVRHYALTADLLDHPNERSSHVAPTPRGGGVAIVATYLAVACGLGVAGFLAPGLSMAIAGAGLLVAVLGFADDHGHVAARWRFLGHMTAAAWVVAWIGPLPPIPVLGMSVDLGVGTMALAALYVVWSINLFNFMDGIDGIASLEVITIAIPGAALAWWVHPASPWAAALLLGASVAGFLVWNFPSARIFMGDAGSGFLGLMVATLGLAIGRLSPPLFWAWFILGGCFMVDATITLFRRWRRGERVYEAHRNHAYQYASRQLGSHKPVTLGVAAINLAWLLPCAIVVATGRIDGIVGVSIAFAPLAWLTLRLKAGDRAAQAGALHNPASGSMHGTGTLRSDDRLE